MQRPFQILILVLTLIISAGFTIGLTYAPCYSSLCSEQFFPYETRLHIATFYALIASIACVLLLRVVSPAVCNLSTYYLARKEVPLLGHRISLGGFFLALWILAITLATTGFWFPTELDFWNLRADVAHWGDANIRLAVTGLIGHHADIILGLVIIPVSRNSLLGHVFELHQSTLLYAHKLLAYLLVVAAFAHGAAYYTFVARYAAEDDVSKAAFNVDNPTRTQAEVDNGSGYYIATLPTGMLAFLAMLVIVITSLPMLRRKSYNTFYYLHVFFSMSIFVLLSIHASTDFYFLLPGLILWMVDWGWRIFRGSGGGLSKEVIAKVENAGEGWYRIQLPEAAKLASGRTGSGANDFGGEKQSVIIEHPIQSYNLICPSISKVQNHAFTVAKVGNVTEGPLILLQRSGGKTQKKLDKEWTWKLGELVSQPGVVSDDLHVRVEGPYVPHTSGYATATHVVCIVGGTGLTGAYSLAMWWLANRAQDTGGTFTLLWTVRHRQTANLREWHELVTRAAAVENMRVAVQVSSEQGRLVPGDLLREAFAQGCAPTTNTRQRNAAMVGWVYASGPEALLSSVETACLDVQRAVKKGTEPALCNLKALDWYSAKWEV